jgi:hypothetical protein
VRRVTEMNPEAREGCEDRIRCVAFVIFVPFVVEN